MLMVTDIKGQVKLTVNWGPGILPLYGRFLRDANTTVSLVGPCFYDKHDGDPSWQEALRPSTNLPG